MSEERLRLVEKEVAIIGTKLDGHITDFRQHEVHDNDRFLEVKDAIEKIGDQTHANSITLQSVVVKVGALVAGVTIIASVFGPFLLDLVKGLLQ